MLYNPPRFAEPYVMQGGLLGLPSSVTCGDSFSQEKPFGWQMGARGGRTVALPPWVSAVIVDKIRESGTTGKDNSIIPAPHQDTELSPVLWADLYAVEPLLREGATPP